MSVVSSEDGGALNIPGLGISPAQTCVIRAAERRRQEGTACGHGMLEQRRNGEKACHIGGQEWAKRYSI